MVHSGIFATKAQCDAMAGELVDVTGYTETNINSWCLEAESWLNNFCRVNFSDIYSASMNADKKALLQEYEARYVAMSAIAYNMVGFATKEAEDMIMIHVYRLEKIEALLGEPANIKFLSTNP
jgi:hypothetical protein